MTSAKSTRRSVAELRPDAATPLRDYCNPAKNYSFGTYDLAPRNDGPLCPADVLMANLLSLRLSGRDVIPLFATGDTPATRLRVALDEALTEARALPPLQDCDDQQVLMPALAHANWLTVEVKWWTAVTVSKVLHRLAPTVPIIDSRVRDFYQTRDAGVLRRVLRDDLRANVGWLSGLASVYPVHDEPMPLARVADILIWMGGEKRLTAGLSLMGSR